MVLGYIIIRSPYAPYSIYLRGTLGVGLKVQDLGTRDEGLEFRVQVLGFRA